MATVRHMQDDISERGGICLCGAIAWSVIFGGRRRAHFKCDKCGREYAINGKLIDRSA